MGIHNIIMFSSRNKKNIDNFLLKKKKHFIKSYDPLNSLCSFSEHNAGPSQTLSAYSLFLFILSSVLRVIPQKNKFYNRVNVLVNKIGAKVSYI